jgi:hypothetical protein
LQNTGVISVELTINSVFGLGAIEAFIDFFYALAVKLDGLVYLWLLIGLEMLKLYQVGIWSYKLNYSDHLVQVQWEQLGI